MNENIQPYLDELAIHRRSRCHLADTDPEMPPKKWEALGRPYLWSILFSGEKITILSDRSRGVMALFIDGILMHISLAYVGPSYGKMQGLYKRLTK